jgi:hypothetical protein
VKVQRDAGEFWSVKAALGRLITLPGRSSAARRWLAVALLLALNACSGGKDAADAPDTPDTPGTGGSTSTSASCPGSGDDQSGSGTVAGALAGRMFDTVAAARYIGAPDSKNTTVVYVFSEPVACAELCATGWDARIADGTQILELKLFGTQPGTFDVVKTATPAPGEASVNTTFVSGGNPAEQGASAGSVELTALAAGQSAQGSFTLAFGSDALTGTFDATYCPGGHEP